MQVVSIRLSKGSQGLQELLAFHRAMERATPHNLAPVRRQGVLKTLPAYTPDAGAVSAANSDFRMDRIDRFRMSQERRKKFGFVR